MQDLQERIKKIVSEITELEKTFDLPGKRKKFAELEEKSTTPNLWDDPEKARKIMQDLGGMEEEITELEQIKSSVDTLALFLKEEELGAEVGKEVAETENKIKKLILKSFLSGPYDGNNAIVGIHAGQGGTEAMDWANMLYRMYIRFCENRNWKTTTFDISEGEEAGIKSVIFKVEGSYAYGYLKGEAGTHRLVRQSPFNADKLRQTSFALVEVLPELASIDLPDIQIKEEDIEWQFFRSSSQGGQNVQKVSTAVRLTHKPSGIIVTAQAQRFQEQNRKIALDLLRSKLWIRAKELQKEKKGEIRGEYRPASWGNQIRSYVLHPYKMVKDLRTDYEVSNPDSILDGELDGFIEAELKLSKE
jgi:peptide chain release factor 2